VPAPPANRRKRQPRHEEADLGDDLDNLDGPEYIASNPDLIDALGADAAAGVRHYLDFGWAEGRETDSFDKDDYLDNYPDLRAAFGDDDAATLHYVQFGYAEGRTDDDLPGGAAAAGDFIV
jgi:hypothetical protein